MQRVKNSRDQNLIQLENFYRCRNNAVMILIVMFMSGELNYEHDHKTIVALYKQNVQQ